MKTFTLLNTAFFTQLEDGNEKNIKALYTEMRTIVIDFAHSDNHWREIHTGLSVFISEVAEIMESATEALSRYAKRILGIAKALLAQIEMALTAGRNNMLAQPGSNETVKEEKKATVTFTGKYADLCELIHLVLAAGFINGASASARQHIVKGLHSLMGLEFDPKRFQNARDGIKRRCPAKGSRVTYFLDSAVDIVNAELAA